MKNVFIETYGCQMNEYDTELVKSILAKENYSFVPTEEEADIIMLNTCAIREHAHRKVYERVHHILWKRQGKPFHQRPGAKPLKIGILGCMATNLRTELLDNKRLKIDFIAGPDSYKRLPQLIAESYNDNGKHFDVTLSEFETYSDITPVRESGVNTWIAVMRGCNNFCSFCVVPYTRGRERSRAPQNIVDEVKKLVDEGSKQVTLLGQNVNSYKYEDYDFAYFLDAVSKVDGIERIRFTSPHPKDFPDNLLQVMIENPKVCKQMHMPLQAGNNRILDIMNRTYTKEEFLALVDKARRLYPDMIFSTDVIVGFSSETEADFQDTCDVMKKAEFDSAFIFKYSERKNTIASKKYPDDVPAAIKTERIVRLNELQREICTKKNKAHVGQIHRILIDSMAPARAGEFCQGRNDGNKIVVIPQSNHKIGDMVDVEIVNASANCLKGIPVSILV